MGEVFVAAKPGPVGFGPYVALKVLRDELACDQQFVDMLVDEANISMFLNHQNVVSVLDLGTDESTYYIAMEYVQGITVERLVDSMAARGKKLAIPVALYIGAELCRALKYAHTRVNHGGEPLNIVHRDVTPANVLLSTQGEVKLTDFGIARAKGRVHQTQAGVLKGKFGYMAPEMVRYERIDARADLFCTGVCLYLMLSGQHPVAGAAVMEAIQRFEDKRIPPPSSLNPEITPALDTVVMRCLEPQVGDRWASAAELGDALQDVMLRQPAWRGASNDGPRLISAQIHEVAPESFEVPVSEEQSRHLLERARADLGQAPDAAAVLGQDRLHSLRERIPSDPQPAARLPDPATEDAPRLEPQDLIELPTATSLPAISPDMDFGATPGVSAEVETDEQLSLRSVQAARRALRGDTDSDSDTDEQNAGPTDDALIALDPNGSDGAVPSAPADATVASPAVTGPALAVSFPDSSTDRSRLEDAMIDEPSLPAAPQDGYAVDPGQSPPERTVAQFEYDEGIIDRPLDPTPEDDGATVVGYDGSDLMDPIALDPSPATTRDEATVAGISMEELVAPADPLSAGVVELAGPSTMADDADAATVIPTGPDGSALDTSDWQPVAGDEDPADATLLDGLDASDVMAAVQAAKARAEVAPEAPAPSPALAAAERLDTAALDQLVQDAVAPTSASAVPELDLPKPLDGPIRIGSAEAPPGAVGPGDVAMPPPSVSPPPMSRTPATAPAPSRSPVPAPAPALKLPTPPAPSSQAVATGPAGDDVGDSTGRWMAGELDANALAWDDDAAARRAVATRNQGGHTPGAMAPVAPGSYPPQPLALPSQPPMGAMGQAGPPQPGFLARNGVLLLTLLLAVAMAGGVGYAWFFTRVFWPKLRLESTPPGATVLVNDRQMPTVTPLVVQIEPGRPHRIEFRRDGFRGTTRQITEEVSQFRNYKLNAVLVPAARQVYLPAEGTVFLNGEAVATGQRVELSKLPSSGKVTLRVEAKGYAPYEHTFEDPSDIPESWDVPLSKL